MLFCCRLRPKVRATPLFIAGLSGLLPGSGNVAVSAVAVALVFAAASPQTARAQAVVGKLGITRQVQVSRGAIAQGQTPQFVDARNNQGVFSGQAIRTLKRALAEITFNDKSVLRINERTDLVLQDSAALRNIQLRSGVVWVRVARGTATQVETPSATAVARGTTFVVGVGANGASQLTVLDGRVDMQFGSQTVSVGAGQTITVAPPAGGGAFVLPGAPSSIPSGQLPTDLGGSAVGWWQQFALDGGLQVTAGSNVALNLRSSPLTEVLQQLAVDNRGVTRQNYRSGGGASTLFINNPALRAQFLSVAQQNLLTSIQNSGLSLSAYQAANGNLPVSALGLTAANAALLQSLGITTVGQAIGAASQNGASLSVLVDTRSAYRGGNITDYPNYDFRILDRNDTSLTILGIGAGLSLIGDAAVNKDLRVSAPQAEAGVWGFADNPSFAGARGRIDGRVGKTHYKFESNVLRILSGNNTRTQGKFDSVAVVEQTIGDSVILFAGRDRFYDGPVFQNAVLSQLIADRYSAAGATVRRGPATFKAAYLYDSNPDVTGAQNGALATFSYKIAGGVIGLQGIRVPKLSDGTGGTVSISYPLIRNKVDFYGEVGRGPDSANLQTYGAYFPGLFQKADVDLFLEYGSHEGIGHAVSLIASKDVGKNVNVRAYLNSEREGRRTQGGLAAIFHIGTK